MSQTAVVTGARGNLGQAFQRELAGAWTIVPIGRDEMRTLEEKVPEACDVVVHAAFNLKDSLGAEPQRVIADNVQSLAVTLNVAVKRGVKLFGLVSSAAVYGAVTCPKEDAALTPVLVNGIVKVLCERMVVEVCRLHGIPFQIYRVFNLYGGTDTFSVVSKLLAHARGEASNFKLNNGGEAVRDFVHVDDVARIIVRLWSSAFRDGALNIGSGRAVRLKELVTIVRDRYPSVRIAEGHATEVAGFVADPERLLRWVTPEWRDVGAWLADQLK